MSSREKITIYPVYNMDSYKYITQVEAAIRLYDKEPDVSLEAIPLSAQEYDNAKRQYKADMVIERIAAKRDADRKGKLPAGMRRSREARKGGPLTLRDHIDDVRGHSLARFLTDDLTVAKELQSDEVEKGVETVDSSVTGLVVDRAVDQKLLDRLVGKGLAYVAAKDFKGIIKRPLSIRLMKMGS